MTTPTTGKAKKSAQTHKHHDIAEDPNRPSQSRWGVKQSSMAEGGVDIGSLSPGKTGDANLS